MTVSIDEISSITDYDFFTRAMNKSKDDSFDGVEDVEFLHDDNHDTKGIVLVTYY